MHTQINRVCSFQAKTLLEHPVYNLNYLNVYLLFLLHRIYNINFFHRNASENGAKCESADASPADQNPSNLTQQIEEQLVLTSPAKVPEDICDFDMENWDDIFQVSHYAMEIFQYLKNRETLFMPKDYLVIQTGVTKWMRSLLVDWMVEIQESFELNHETLYLGVKLVDLYLSYVYVNKDNLQLVGAAAMFIASKYDERIPPLINDFLYICDGAYKRDDLLRMEMNLLKICDFNLGIPISYRFLRRYARVSKICLKSFVVCL